MLIQTLYFYCLVLSHPALTLPGCWCLFANILLLFFCFLLRLCWRWCMRRAAKYWLCQSIPLVSGSWKTSPRPEWQWRAGRRRDYPCWMLSSHWRITSARWRIEETRYDYTITFKAGSIYIKNCILCILIYYETCVCICIRSNGQFSLNTSKHA